MKPLNDITGNNSEGLDPHLNRSGNKNPFRTEADYFDNFADKLMSKVEEHAELSFEAPVLSSIPKYNPFTLPKDYFEDLPSSVQQRTASGSHSSWLDWLKMAIRPNFAVPVACVIIIAFTGIHYLNNSQAPKNEIAREINIDEQLQDIDETTLADALSASGTTETEVNPENENIKQYLIDNNIDETNLTYEL